MVEHRVRMLGVEPPSIADVNDLEEVTRIRRILLGGGRVRMTVDSPKSEHHEGKAYRVVPIFPEVGPFLEQAWHRADERAEYVVEAWRSQVKNLRTRMLRAIRRAGLKAWTKLFQNLRSSCQTDLEEQFPSHIVCTRLGNSERIAREHYLQVIDTHFAKATDDKSMGHLLAQVVTECHEQSGGTLSNTEEQPKPLHNAERPMKRYPGTNALRNNALICS